LRGATTCALDRNEKPGEIIMVGAKRRPDFAG
jgi:hypothetical protein